MKTIFNFRRILLVGFIMLVGLEVHSQSLQFNGSNQYVTVPHDLRFRPQNFTFEAWVYVNSSGSFQTILSKGGGNAATNTSYYFSITDDSKIGLYISNGSSSFIGRSTSTVSTSTWHHVAVSYASNGSVAHFYLDGAPAGTHTYSLTLDGGTETEPLFIGRQGYECQCNYFDGNIDELRIWNSDRTAAQIANSAKFPPELSETGLLAYYDFNQGSGTTLDDIKETLSVPDFDGTLVNSPTWSTMEPDITVLPGTSNYVDFDGTSDYILVDNLSNGGSGAFSAEAWVVQDGIGVRSDIVAFADVNIEFYISSNGGLVATTPNGTVSFSFQSYIDELTHVAFTADNTSLKLYVNGANVSTQAASGSMPAISGDMYIGMAKNQASQVGFDGRITDLRIWNDIRTTAEIQTNISSVLTGSEAGLVALYTMSEGSGTALNDLSSNNNDGVFYEGQTGATGFGQLANTNGPRWTSDVNAVFPEFTTYYTLSAPERSTGVVSDINARLGANGSDDAGITYSLSGTDATYFSINISTGELSTNTNLDFDYPVDADEDNVYELLVTATDGSLSNTKVYGYSALDTDCSVDYKAPANAGSSSGYSHVFLSTFYQSFQPCATGEMGFLRLNAGSVPSTGTLTIFVETSQGPLGLVNVNLGALNWNVLAGSYTTYTIIDLTEYTSQLSSPVILYEGNDYMVGVIGTDALFGFQPNTRPGKLYGASFAENTQYDLIFEMDVIEAQNNAPTFMSASSVDFDENATGTVIDVDARDEYDPNSHTLGTPVDLNITYTLSGADASQFNVDANNGIVTFINQPDFENPADADGNNVYEITVTADDGLSTQQNITVTVTDGAEPPAFTSVASIALEENHSGTVLDVDAIAFGETAPDIGLTYSISGGNDLDDFEIDNTSGVLTFAAIPDFENPADANTDNIYTITVTASDGIFDAAQEITVEITNGDDVPIFTSGLTVSFVENETGVVYTATATDLESTPTFSLAQGGDNDLFNMTSGGELTFITAPDFETPGDDNSDNQYEIEILATDDANQSTSLMVTVSVTDATEAPTDIFLDNTIIGSNNTIGQIVGTLSAQSQDVAAIITFELVSGFGDHSSFVLDGAKLKAAEIFDASVKSTYSIQIRAFDVDNNDFTKELAITVQETIFDPNALLVTSGASDGAGSLREAIAAAELNPGKDIINITSGAGTISLTAQLPDITQDLDIIGAGKLTTIIDGGGSVRPFLILTGNVVISDLTIQNGLGKGGDTFGGGAGAGMGGAIYIDNGDVTIERVVFKGNEALGGSSNVGSHDGGDGPLPGLGGAEGETINNFTTGLAGGDGGFGAGGGRGGFGTQGAGGGGNGGYGAGGGGGSTDPFGGEPGGSGGSFAGNGGANGSAGGAGAGLGGAVFIRNGSLHIDQASFEDNQALAGAPGSGGGSAQAKGGAVFTMAGTIATAYQTTFSNNIAADAGATATDNGDSYGTLEIISELAISTQPTNLSINQGDNATFTAVVSGSGPSYQWQYFDGSEWLDIVDAGAYSGATTDELTITCGDLALDQQEYRVVIAGTINTVTSDPAILTVTTAPALEVTITGSAGIACDGVSATFTAVPSNNNGAPAYQWYVNNQAVANETSEMFTANFNIGDEVYVSLSDPASCFSRPTVQSDELTIVASDLIIMVTNALGGVSDVNSLAWAVNEVNNYVCTVEAVIDLRNLPDNSTITLDNLLRIATTTTIIGKGSDLLMITANTNNTGDGQIFTVNDEGVDLTLEGMTIQNTGITQNAIGVNASNANTTLTNVSVDGFVLNGITIRGKNAVLTDVVSTNNGGAGLEMRLNSDNADGMLTIDGGSFSSNTTWGVDLSTYSNEKMNFNFENTMFENNQRGLLYNGDADSGIIMNCSFIGHSQFGMEIVANNEIIMDISNSTFAQNGTNTTGPWQGAFYFDFNITASINNCTIANNSFGIIAANATVDLNNSILLGQIRSNTLLDGGTISSSSGHNLGVALGTNSDDNVLLSDVLNASLTESNGLKFYELVSCTSPAINAGDDQLASEFDQLGNARLGTADIGAIEFQVGITVEPQDVVIEPSTASPPVFMHIEAAGASAYQWQVDGGSGFVNIELFDTDYSGADTDMLTINNLSVGIAYRVEVTTTCGTIYSDIAYVLEKTISFTSPASADFNENLTGAVLDIDAKYGIDGNPDDGITYAIVGGADQGLFEIDVETGVCSITSELNFENPTDAGLDNTLEVIVQATNGLVSTDQTIIISIQNLDEWIGTASASWSDPSTWESGNVPGPTDDVSIPPSVDIISLDDVRSVRNLTVSSGVMISISDGGALAIFGEYFGEGEVEQTREITGTASGGYSIVGSPMTVTPDVSTLPIVVYEYAGTTGFTRKTSGSLDPGKGYFLREAQTDGIPLDLALGGRPNTGDISVAVSTAGDGFNLLANPYTAAISVVDFIDNNPAIDGTLYLWDDGGENSGATRGGDYIAVNRMGVAGVVNNGGFSGNTGSGVFDMNIGSLQGFFAEALTDGNITFSQDMQVTTSASNAVFFRVSGEHEVMLPQTITLSLSNGELSNMILLGLAPEATMGRDRGYDSDKFSGNDEISFYTRRRDQEYSIEGLGMIEEREEAVFNLEFDLANKGSYTLKLEEQRNLSENMDIVLIDKVENKEYGLKELNHITFYSEATQNNDRFAIKFVHHPVLSTLQKIAFSLLGIDGGLNISYPSGTQEEVIVTSLEGKQVTKQSVSFASGSAFVEVSLQPKKLYILTIRDQSIKFLITE